MDETIRKTKNSFEAAFADPYHYNKQTRDSAHLESILNFLHLKDGDRVLDLGTGGGYLSFAIAEKYPRVTVTGFDIVSDALEFNKQKARERNMNNITFVSYDGIYNPFENETFDCVATRYALHHFPDIQHCFDEVSRVLVKGGRFFISDPTPNEDDCDGFVDAYMQLLDDGHRKFYTLAEFTMLANNAGMEFAESYDSSITFACKINKTYYDLFDNTSEDMLKSYCVNIDGDKCYITEKVVNVVFRKNN